MLEEGYFQDRAPTLAGLAPVLAKAVETCHRLDIPPAFIFLFDEPWAAFFSLDPMLRFFLGPTYRALPDFWTWRLDPARADAGWRPHRQISNPVTQLSSLRSQLIMPTSAGRRRLTPSPRDRFACLARVPNPDQHSNDNHRKARKARESTAQHKHCTGSTMVYEMVEGISYMHRRH